MKTTGFSTGSIPDHMHLSVLSDADCCSVNGGAITVSPVLAVGALVLGIIQFCYSVGKDCAIRENSK